MKQIITFLLLLPFFVTSHSYAQWYQQNSGTNWLNRIDFVSVDIGWAGAYWKIIKTTDSGETWNTVYEVTGNNTHIESFDFVDASKGWFLLYDGESSRMKIFSTTDGGENWSLQYTSIQYIIYWEIQFIDENRGWCIGNYLFSPIILITTDGGNNWYNENVDPNNYPDLNLVSFINANTGWVGGQAIYKTTDGGYTWTAQMAAYTLMMGLQFVNSEIGWYTDDLYLLKTTDGGNTWNQQFYHGTFGWDEAPFFFVDTDNGWIAYNNIIYHTTNGGADWVWQSPGASFSAADMYFVDANNGWIAGSGGIILHTTNGGLPVELVSFTAEVKESAVILKWKTATETNNQGFDIERKAGSKQSTVGNDWVKIGYVAGFGSTTESKTYSFTDDNVISGKYSYRLKQIDFDGTFKYSPEVEVEVPVLNQFILEQNYPNPFNSSTIISWQSPVSSWQTLKVYDVLGNEVATLVNEEKPTGSYEVEFDATGLPSGIYIYKLTVGNFTDSKKLILLR